MTLGFTTNAPKHYSLSNQFSYLSVTELQTPKDSYIMNFNIIKISELAHKEVKGIKSIDIHSLHQFNFR